jgi:FemAB-related protein (PEP-CTERM system-associated)
MQEQVRRHDVTHAGGAPSASGSLVVRGESAAHAQMWADYVSRAPDATFCHLPGWASVVARTWGHRTQHLYAERGGSLVGVLPLFHVRSRLFGSVLVSSPNAVYGGPIADDSEVRRGLIEEAKRLAERLGVQYLELRDTREVDGEAKDSELHQKDLYVTFEHPIVADDEAMLLSFPRDIRRMIRNASKHGLSSLLGGIELLNEFYEVYATSVRNLGTPVFPKKLFRHFLEEFPDACDILVISQNARVVGAVMSFYFRDAVLPYFGGAYPEAYRTGVNNFMYWELMRSAATRGFSRFDFGRSKRETGAYHFKRGWGMSERRLPYKYYLVRAKELPNLTPLNPKFDRIIAFWKRLPVGLTKVVGPVIVKGLP